MPNQLRILTDQHMEHPISLPPIYHEYYANLTSSHRHNVANRANSEPRQTLAAKIIGLWGAAPLKVGRAPAGGFGGGYGFAKKREENSIAAKKKRQERIDQYRLEILTRGESLMDGQSRLQEIKAENLQLRKAYDDALRNASASSGILLDYAKEQESQVKRIRRTHRRNRRQCQEESEALKLKLEAGIQDLNLHLEKAQSRLDAAIQEHEDMKIFKNRMVNEPQVLIQQKEGWKKRVESFRRESDAKMQSVMNKFEEEKKEIENRVWSELSDFIEKKHLGVDNSGETQDAVTYNRRLKHELDILTNHLSKTQVDIVTLIETNGNLQKELAKSTDDRRRVLKLNEAMTCTPECQVQVTGREGRRRTV